MLLLGVVLSVQGATAAATYYFDGQEFEMRHISYF